MRRISADVVIAVALLAICGFLLNNLLGTEASGAFVKTTTLPIALVVVLAMLSAILLGGALWRGARHSPTDGAEINNAGLRRVLAMLVWTVLFIAALPWGGYLFTTAIFLVGANLLYGNRNPVSIAAIAVLVPVFLYLFFEKYMIILLPSSRLIG